MFFETLAGTKGRHCVELVEPVPVVVVPSEQEVQLPIPVAEAYVPMAHGRHEDNPA
jgi:hypothetical protein